MASRSFLWINKDPKSKSLSNNRTGPLPYSQINKHVQRQTARRKLKRKVVKSSAQELVGWQTNSASDDGSDDQFIKQEDSGDDVEEILPTRLHHPNSHVDSYPNSLIRLSNSEQNALQYFLKVWMPSDDFIPHDCQIAGFTPIWPGDGNASSRVVQGALQTDDPVSIYALSHGCDSPCSNTQPSPGR